MIFRAAIIAIISTMLAVPANAGRSEWTELANQLSEDNLGKALCAFSYRALANVVERDDSLNDLRIHQALMSELLEQDRIQVATLIATNLANEVDYLSLAVSTRQSDLIHHLVGCQQYLPDDLRDERP